MKATKVKLRTVLSAHNFNNNVIHNNSDFNIHLTRCLLHAGNFTWIIFILHIFSKLVYITGVEETEARKVTIN